MIIFINGDVISDQITILDSPNILHVTYWLQRCCRVHNWFALDVEELDASIPIIPLRQNNVSKISAELIWRQESMMIVIQQVLPVDEKTGHFRNICNTPTPTTQLLVV